MFAGSWRGKNPIQRNAMIALAHFKDESALEDLVDLLNDDRTSNDTSYGCLGNENDCWKRTEAILEEGFKKWKVMIP